MIHATPTITEVDNPAYRSSDTRVFRFEKQGISRPIFLNDNDVKELKRRFEQLGF